MENSLVKDNISSSVIKVDKIRRKRSNRILATISIVALFVFGIVDSFIFKGNIVNSLGGSSSGEFMEYSGFNVYAKYISQGESVVVENLSTVKELINDLNAKEVLVEKVGDIVNYYYYSTKIPNKVYLKGKKVNLHIAVASEKVTMGTPIIYYGY